MLPQVVTYLPGLRPLSTMELYTDTYYIQRIQAGDVACFACLLDKYSRPIHSLILKVVRSQEEAEELAQDTFMKVFKNLASFKGDCSFSTWIYRIAYNTAISSVRKKRYEFLAIEETTLENVSEEEVTNLFGQTESTEQVQRLEVALEQLLPDERALILLFYWKEKTIEELVSITGLTASNIKVKLHRIRKKLFVLLNEGNYILLCTISKTIKGHMIMYPFIIQSFFSFFFPFPSFLTLQERVFRKRGSRGSIFGL